MSEVEISSETRAAIKAKFLEFETSIARIEETARPFREALKPFLNQLHELYAAREVFFDEHGVEVAGKCEHCEKLLFVGEPGSRPYSDEADIIFCAAHGMTYGNAKSNWEDNDPADDDEDQVEARVATLKLVEDHIAAGGALTDLMPVGTL